MTSNITTLAINLLISERMNHRIEIAAKIGELLNQSIGDAENEKTAKNNLLVAVAKCTQDPNCESRNDFYDLAQYFAQKINSASGLSEVA